MFQIKHILTKQNIYQPTSMSVALHLDGSFWNQLSQLSPMKTSVVIAILSFVAKAFGASAGKVKEDPALFAVATMCTPTPFANVPDGWLPLYYATNSSTNSCPTVDNVRNVNLHITYVVGAKVGSRVQSCVSTWADVPTGWIGRSMGSTASCPPTGTVEYLQMDLDKIEGSPAGANYSMCIGPSFVLPEGYVATSVSTSSYCPPFDGHNSALVTITNVAGAALNAQATICTPAELAAPEGWVITQSWKSSNCANIENVEMMAATVQYVAGSALDTMIDVCAAAPFVLPQDWVVTAMGHSTLCEDTASTQMQRISTRYVGGAQTGYSTQICATTPMVLPEGFIVTGTWASPNNCPNIGSVEYVTAVVQKVAGSDLLSVANACYAASDKLPTGWVPFNVWASSNCVAVNNVTYNAAALQSLLGV